MHDELKPTDYPVLVVPGKGEYFVKLDMGVFYDIEEETGLDYLAVLSKLYSPSQNGTPAKISTVQMFELLARSLYGEGQAMSGRELAACYGPGDHLALGSVLGEALKKSKLPLQTPVETATPAEQPTN
jgi:hypothetical protein